MEDDDVGSYLSAPKFIKLLEGQIKDLSRFLIENKASDIESYRHTTGRIMGLRQALDIFINKKK